MHIETFAALEAFSVNSGFLGRVPGLDVHTDRVEALKRLEVYHQRGRQELGMGELPFITAEQVHGKAVAVVRRGKPLPDGVISGADGIITDRADVCLGIYVADCCAVYLVDPVRKAIGLVHAGRKGTELAIVCVAIAAMADAFGSATPDLVVQLSPCIRPPWYEVDFAAQIVAQCREAGVEHVHDNHRCTAAELEHYYSYRREKGQTGRMLALLALR